MIFDVLGNLLSEVACVICGRCSPVTLEGSKKFGSVVLAFDAELLAGVHIVNGTQDVGKQSAVCLVNCIRVDEVPFLIGGSRCGQCVCRG